MNPWKILEGIPEKITVEILLVESLEKSLKNSCRFFFGKIPEIILEEIMEKFLEKSREKFFV